MSDHEWCRDVRRDEQVRAAEDAAAVPSIQHRDLPEQVALLWASVGDLIGRVVRLEGEMDAGQDEEAAPAVCDSAHLDAHRGESVRVVEAATIGTGDVFADVQCGSTADEIARLTAERDAAIRERDAAREEYELLRARADPFGEEMAVIAAWERCAITADWPADEPETAMRCAASMEREIVRLRARVAVLEAAPPPRGWLTAKEREEVQGCLRLVRQETSLLEQYQPDHPWMDHWLRTDAALSGLLARETPPRVKRRGPWTINGVPGDGSQAWKPVIDATLAHRDDEWIAAIRAAGGEVE